MIKSTGLILYLYTLYLSGIILFMIGFFPVSYNSDDIKATEEDFPTSIGSIKLNERQFYKRRFQKVVLMVIDALRYDFALSSHMSFTNEKLLKGEACAIKLKAEAPTVTLPRLKSLTTGTISNFIDVILNFGSTELFSDSIIYQIKHFGGRIVFSGDNTWNRLFPETFYRKYLNNDSFFVQDFYEGDKQITRQVRKELQQQNWDVLILHYLGLDHIGHVEGPFSSKVPTKLQEMDDVIRTLNENLYEKDSLVLVTADHGMHDAGGHGGSSVPELIVPFLFFNGSCKTNRQAFYMQLDMAPTVAVLYGVPIPKTSIGCIITELIDFLPQEDQLYALHYNSDHLVKKTINKSGCEGCLYYHNKGIQLYQEFLALNNRNLKSKLFQEAKSYYEKSAKTLSEFLAHELIHFDMLAIVLGVIIATIGTVLIIQAAFFLYRFPKFQVQLGRMVLISFGISGVLQLFICKVLSLASQLCVCRYFGTVIISLLVSLLYLLNQQYFNIREVYYKKPPFLLAVIILYSISLQSSSFIEEEHQTWHYLVTTFLLYLSIREICTKENYLVLVKIARLNSFIEHNFQHCSKGSLSMHIGKGIAYEQNVVNWLSSVVDAIRWVLLLTLHIFIRRLNQTGDKWAHLPDIGDWLNSEGKQIELNIHCLLGLILSLISLKSFTNKWTYGLSSMAATSIYFYRATTGLIYANMLELSKVSLTTFWLCISGIVLSNYFVALHNILIKKQNRLNNVRSLLKCHIVIFGLISMLLHKPHNVVLVGSCIITLRTVFHALNAVLKSREELLVYKVVSAILVGKMFFFYQGNSNHLASIDLNPGFIGLSEYNFYIAATLITLNTYFGPLCSIVVLLYESLNENDEQTIKTNVPQMFLLITLCVAVPTNVYLFVMVNFRSHLFIWSVFSPKLLYEAFTVSLHYFVLIILYIFYKFLRII